MKKYSLMFIILFICHLGYSQNRIIEIVSQQNDTGILITAKNNSSTQLEVTLNLEIVNLNGYKKPIIILVSPKQTVQMASLTFIENKPWQLKTEYFYESKPTKEEAIIWEQKLTKRALTDKSDINKGTVVFYKEGCSRSFLILETLLQSNLKFKVLNTKDMENNNLMWKVVKEKNSDVKDILMPVIVKNGHVNYNIKDLNDFSEKLIN